jgi:ATP-dependent Clp protease protease subunit
LAHHTGKSDEAILHDSDRDYYMTAQEAKDYGLVDEVVKLRKDVPAGTNPSDKPKAGEGDSEPRNEPKAQ